MPENTIINRARKTLGLLIDPDRNRSPSFGVFRDVLIELTA